MKAENKIQQEIVQWFRANHYKKGVIFSVPNERAGGYLAMKDLLLTGLLSGVSDLIVVLPNKVLFVEVKTSTGTQKPNQIKFQKNIENLGLEYHLVRSLLEFKALVK
jgi:hypothetical protein